jgi:hypothetical protein
VPLVSWKGTARANRSGEGKGNGAKKKTDTSHEVINVSLGSQPSSSLAKLLGLSERDLRQGPCGV